MTTAEKLNTVYGAFNGIKDAITEKGGTPGASITEYPQNILDLPSGGGDDLKDFLEGNGTEFTVPAGTTKLKNYCFAYTSYTTINIPNSVNTLGANSFYYCSTPTINLPESITKIPANGFGFCLGNTLNAPNVTYIDSYSFGSSKIVNITHGELTYLGLDTFQNYTAGTVYDNCYYCGDILARVKTKQATHQIKEGTKYIAGTALSNNTTLTNITLPEGIITIGHNAFYYDTNLTNITIPSTLKYINTLAFMFCSKLTEVYIPENVISIASSAFLSCTSLTKATFDSIESLCKINYLNLESNPVYNAKHIYIGENEITSVVIPDAVDTIKYGAFYRASFITDITVSDSVKTILGSSLSYLSGCNYINFGNTRTDIPTLSSTSNFTSAKSGFKIIVPDALYDQWITTTNWSYSTIRPYIIKYSDAIEQGIITE